MELLTSSEMEELTGSKQPSKQAEVLDRNGIYYILKRDNTLTTTWHHVNNPRRDQQIRNDSVPDFGAIQ